MPNCAIHAAHAHMIEPVARREISTVGAMQTRFDRTAEVEAHGQFQRLIGGAALAELRGRRHAIAEDFGFRGELMRRQGDGDG